MAIDPKTDPEFVGKIDESDPEGYPYGKAQNIGSEGDLTGTPWKKNGINDLFGYQQASLNAAGIIPSGTPEKVGASQYLEAARFHKGEMQGVNELATSAERQSMISTGLWDKSWGATSDAANLIEGGSLKAYQDLATFFNTDGAPRLLAADGAVHKIDVWDPRTLLPATDYSTSGDLTDDLPAGITAALIHSICTDGISVYVTIRDISASPDDYYIQAWDITTWGVKSGWPALGTKLTPTGNSKYFKAIIASATRIAVINSATTISASGDPVIEIVNIDTGAIVADGAGDAPTGISAVADPVIASDGTYVYFAVTGGSAFHLCSAEISDPTTGCGGAGWGDVSGGDLTLGAIVVVGDKIVTFLDRSAYSEGNIVISTHKTSERGLGAVLLGRNALATPVVGDKYIYGGTMNAKFDGFNIWAFVQIDNLSSGKSGALLKIDISKLNFNSDFGVSGRYPCIDDLQPSLFAVMPENPISFSLPQMGLEFDGRDIWAVAQAGATALNSGKIARLPLATLRH